MSIICKYCNNTFSKLSVLNTHQKNTKYCLVKQGQIENQINIEIFDCKYCNKVFSRSGLLNNHVLECEQREKYHKKLRIYQKFYQDLSELSFYK